MPIRPIDIMKTQEVTQYKSFEHQKVQHEQVQISKSFQEMVQRDLQKPVQAEKSENKEFRYDAKEKGQNSYSGSKNKQQQNQKKDSHTGKKTNVTSSTRSGGFDVSI